MKKIILTGTFCIISVFAIHAVNACATIDIKTRQPLLGKMLRNVFENNVRSATRNP